MKKTIFIILAIIAFLGSAIFIGCHKEQSVEKITVENLNTKYHIDLIGAWEDQFGTTARVNPNGNKKPQKGDIVNLILDGHIEFDGTTFTTSDKPKFAGVNNQSIFVSICNWFFFDENGSAQTLTCNYTDQHGNIMAWNTNWGNDVFRSDFFVVP